MRLAVLACVGLAALSLLFPSSPTYDPWAWIVWGREIAHLDLSTVEGPSWKPLPVAFTTVFSLSGSAGAPALWLVVARAGALLSVVLAFRVARRLSGGSVAGGAAAAGALIIAPWMLRHCGLGNSEGILAACVLGAVDRHLDGRPRQAFALAFAAGLLRPEAWPFLGLYGLWLVWRHRDVLRVAVAAAVALPVLWFVPEQLGSGRWLRAAERAQKPRPGSPAFSDTPVADVLRDAADLLTWPVWAGIAGLVVVLLVRRPRREDALGVLVVVAMATAWLGVVAYMTKDGFSGNQRYLMMPAILLTVAAGAGVGWVARALGEDQLRPPARTVLAVGVAVLFAVPAMGRLGGMIDFLDYQGRLPHALATVVDQAGGAARIRRCAGDGQLSTGPFLVPAVAWQLHVHTVRVDPDPRTRPIVVFRTRTNEGSRPVPALNRLGPAPLATLGRVENWRILASCGGWDTYHPLAR